jgi:hypothetical protein
MNYAAIVVVAARIGAISCSPSAKVGDESHLS